MNESKLLSLIAVLETELDLTPIGSPGRSTIVRSISDLKAQLAALRAARFSSPSLF